MGSTPWRSRPMATRPSRPVRTKPSACGTSPRGSCLRTNSKDTPGLVTAVALTPDGNTAVSGSADNTLRVWDVATGELLHTLEGHTGFSQSRGAHARRQHGRLRSVGTKPSAFGIWSPRGHDDRRLSAGVGRQSSLAVTAEQSDCRWYQQWPAYIFSRRSNWPSA